jgi:transcription initiation factor TFIIIB Brf1 subunit/transcription initiation factor TFIIB
MEKLKECPFCGGEPEIKQDCKNGYKLRCKNCLVGYRQKVLRQSMEWLKNKMIEKWNNRKP